MRYFLMVLSIGAVVGASAAGLLAVAVWPDIEPSETVRVVDRVVEVERAWAEVAEIETPVIDSLFFTEEDWAEVDRQSDCLFDWLQEQVGYDITLERVLAAGYWTDALGGPCYVMGRD
jgi:hypothetical protein